LSPVRADADLVALAAAAPARPRDAHFEGPDGCMPWCGLVLKRLAPVFVELEPEPQAPGASPAIAGLPERSRARELRLGKHVDARLLDQAHVAFLRGASTRGRSFAFLEAAGLKVDDAAAAAKLAATLEPFARGGWLFLGERTACAFGAAIAPATWIRAGAPGARHVERGSPAARILKRGLQLAWLDLDEDGRFTIPLADAARVAAEHVVFDRRVGDFRDLVQVPK